jgi:parvulin-like peptidyl-prolyl isomerase
MMDWRSLLVVAAATSGCASNEPYPEKWPLLANDRALCAHIDGDYTPYDYPSRLLISRIAGNDAPKQPAEVLAADRLGLIIADKTLTATAYLDGKVIAQRQHDIQCGGESLALNLGGKFEAGQGALGFESTLLRLRKDSAGSIVVNRESSGIGAYGPIPFAGSASGWVGRFLPYDPNATIPQKPSDRPKPCQYNISQIRAETKEDAEKIEKALNEGESFEQLAATHNRLFLRLEKGLIGWVSPSLFPKWGPTIVGLKKGEYSRKPVEDEAGWHIIKVNDVRPAGCVALMAP